MSFARVGKLDPYTRILNIVAAKNDIFEYAINLEHINNGLATCLAKFVVAEMDTFECAISFERVGNSLSI
jgi:hypothetical protein